MHISCHPGKPTVTIHIDIGNYSVLLHKPKETRKVHPLLIIKKMERKAFAVNSTTAGKILREAVEKAVRDQLIESEMSIEWLDPDHMRWKLSAI